MKDVEEEFEMCEKCQVVFEAQDGQLRVMEMCESCKQKMLEIILNPTPNELLN